MPSQKTKVIEHLFFKHWNKDEGKLTKSTMSLSDVQAAIEGCNEKFGSKLSTRNPANFMKDIVRGQNASKNWPISLQDLRYTGAQRTGEGDVFEFVLYKPGQTEPFPDLYKPRSETPRYPIQTISMPLAAKELGRSDEPWLVQTAVNLRVIETHFAVVSEVPVVHISHLQMSVKLRSTEIDALFLAMCKKNSEHYPVVITCEAKQAHERILEDQIITQVMAALEATEVDLVVPLGLRVVKGTGIYIVEFNAISREKTTKLESLKVSKEAVFELHPPVPGI